MDTDTSFILCVCLITLSYKWYIFPKCWKHYSVTTVWQPKTSESTVLFQPFCDCHLWSEGACCLLFLNSSLWLKARVWERLLLLTHVPSLTTLPNERIVQALCRCHNHPPASRPWAVPIVSLSLFVVVFMSHSCLLIDFPRRNVPFQQSLWPRGSLNPWALGLFPSRSIH